MSDCWTAILSRPALLLPHPDPYPFTKQVSKSQSQSSQRSRLKFASRRQHPSSRSLVTQLVRRATTTTKPSNESNVGDDQAPKLDLLYFPVINLTVPSYEEDMDGLALANTSPSSKAKNGLATPPNPEAEDAKIGCDASYNESGDENDKGNVTESRSPNSKCLPIMGSSRFKTHVAVLQNPLYKPGDQLHQPPSAQIQHAAPRLGLVHDMTEELTSPYSQNNSFLTHSHSNSNSSSSCSIILHALATSCPSSTPALAFSLDMDTNAQFAMMKVGKGMEMAGSTPSAPPPTWTEVPFDTPLAPGESPSTSTSTSIAVSASSACSKSPMPEGAVTTDIDIADKDTMAAMPTAQVSRSKSTFMRWKSKRLRRQTSRRLDDGGECKSDTYPGVEDAKSVASTSAPTSPPSPSVIVAKTNQTYIHKHKRTTSLGDAAVSLLLGVEQRKEKRNDDDDEPKDFEFSEKWTENATQDTTRPIKRAHFVILGSESDVDLPSYVNSGRSSPLPPLHPVPPSEPLFTSSPTPSPLASKVSSAAHLPEVAVASVSANQLHSEQPSVLASTSSSGSSSQRPALLRRDALADWRESVRQRRWTLASAMTDEAISNEGLVRELERMHELGMWNRELLLKEGERSSEGDTLLVDPDSMWDVGREIWEGMLDREKEKGKVDDDDEVVNRSPSSSLLSSSSWLTAQRALLICRELIMTERHYHALLLSLLAGDTHTPPPPLMQHYAAELVRASAAVLRAMEQQPSALGVAKAFVENVEEVEGAYVRWCGVVGGWFVAGGGVEESGTVKLKRNLSRYRASIDSATPPTAADAPGYGGVESEDGSSPVSPLKRTVRTWRRSLPSVASLGEAGASIYGYGYVYGSRSLRRRNKEVDKVAEVEQSDAVGRDLSSTTTPSSPSSSSGQNLTSRPPRVRGKSAVRELAIQPTQRVMRYVLLYRDLLSHTPPTSSSRVFVEQAVDAACRIADKCNRAQGNAAFIVAGGGTAAAGTDPAATQSAAEAETTTRRSNSGRTTTTTTTSSSVDSTPPSSVEGERQRGEVEEEEEDEEERDKLDPESSDGCHRKLSSSMRRMSMNVSFMSSVALGWGRS